MRELRFGRAEAPLFAVEDGSGRVLVMLHGPMADHRAAWPLVAPLAPQYRVVAPDVRGSGRSHDGSPLSFERLSEDLETLLDHLGAERAVIGGVSGGSGIAVHFARTRPRRVDALVLVKPVYAGAELGFSEHQRTIFAGMDALAQRAPSEGIRVLRPLYANLPPAIRDKALAMLDEFDPASVAATSRFVVSGTQPFTSAGDLALLGMPVLLIRGDDPIHPAAVSDLYAQHMPACTVLAADADVPRSIGEFLAL